MTWRALALIGHRLALTLNAAAAAGEHRHDLGDQRLDVRRAARQEFADHHRFQHVGAHRRADSRRRQPRQLGGVGVRQCDRPVQAARCVPSRRGTAIRQHRMGVTAGHQQGKRLHQLHQRTAREGRRPARCPDAERTFIEHRKQRPVHLRPPGHIADRRGEGWPGFRRRHTQPGKRHRFHQHLLFRRRHRRDALAIDVPPEGLGATEIAQRLAKIGIPRLAEDRRNVRRHRDRVYVLGQRGAADEPAFGLRHLAGNVDEHQRLPGLVEVFVCDIALVVLSDVLQSCLDGRIGLEEQRTGLLQPVDEIQHRGDGQIAALRVRLGQHMHQPLHRGDGGPTGGRIVAEVDQATRLESPGHRRHQAMSVGRRDPAQHTMRDHEVEIRQCAVRHCCEVGKRGLDEMHVGQPGACGQRAGELDVCRIEVEAPDLRVRTAGRDGQRGEPVAAAEIGIAEGSGEIRRAVAEQQAGHGEPGRCDLAVVVAGIGHIGHVAVVPFGHCWRFLAAGWGRGVHVSGGGRVCQPIWHAGGQPMAASPACSSWAFSSAPSRTA